MTLEIKTEEREGKVIRVIDLDDNRRIRLIKSEQNCYLEIGPKSTDNQFWLERGERNIAIYEDEIDAITRLLQQARP
ncbi:hypothetical protein KKA69_03270 [Patescibacteria group bacterium]|nr:hypothetical protein [Patescibacteria group bacterium]